MSAPRLSCETDHLVVTAPTLAVGEDYVLRALGTDMERGGEHDRMGTHNRLLKLGERLYLEVIAPNPAAPPPSRRRWFALDGLGAASEPRLATWVVRTNDIQTAAALSREDTGQVEPMNRGALTWRITVRDDGSLACDGVMPSIIQWDTEAHPAARMHETGCRLVRLEGYHPEAERIWRSLRALGYRGVFTVSRGTPGTSARLVAVIETPAGARTLGG